MVTIYCDDEEFSGETVIEALTEARVLSVIADDDPSKFRLIEQCDGYYFATLTREQLLVLAGELRALAETGMQYVYEACRHRSRYRHKYATLGEAIQSAAADLDAASAWPVKISYSSGNVIWELTDADTARATLHRLAKSHGVELADI